MNLCLGVLNKYYSKSRLSGRQTKDGKRFKRLLSYYQCTQIVNLLNTGKGLENSEGTDT